MKRWQKQIDFGEKMVLLIFYTMLLYEFLSDRRVSINMQDIIFFSEETFMMLFVALRRPAAHISTNPYEWAVSLGGAVVSSLYRPSLLHPLVSSDIIAVVASIGMVVEWLGKFSLGRSIGVIPARRSLKMNGVYRLVRHPIYAGYLMIYISVTLGAPSPQNIAVLALTTIGLILRIRIEERLLSQDNIYQTYKQLVRYRMLPGVF